MTTSAFSRSTSTNADGTWTDFKHISASASRLGLIDFAIGARHHTDEIVEFLDMDAEEAQQAQSRHGYEAERA